MIVTSASFGPLIGIVVADRHLPDALVFLFRSGCFFSSRPVGGLRRLVLVRELDVDVLRLRAARDELLGFGELRVDDLLELVERLRAAEVTPLMRNAGVPLAPIFFATAMSSSTFSAYFFAP